MPVGVVDARRPLLVDEVLVRTVAFFPSFLRLLSGELDKLLHGLCKYVGSKGKGAGFILELLGSAAIQVLMGVVCGLIKMLLHHIGAELDFDHQPTVVFSKLGVVCFNIDINVLEEFDLAKKKKLVAGESQW